MSFDQSNATDLATLKDEVNNDPRGVGFAGFNGSTSLILEALNTVSSNPSSDTVNVPFDEFPAIEAIDEIVNSEYVALNEIKKARVDAIIQSAINDPECLFGPLKAMFKKAFGNTSATWLAVKDDRARDASISEALFGRDTVITRDNWIAARES